MKSSLQLDGFEVDPKNLTLLPLEGPVTTKDEEDALTLLVKRSGIQNHAVICKHIEDAHTLFVQSKDHPSLNESRSLLQALVDEISFATNTHGGHSVALPGGTGTCKR